MLASVKFSWLLDYLLILDFLALLIQFLRLEPLIQFAFSLPVLLLSLQQLEHLLLQSHHRDPVLLIEQLEPPHSWPLSEEGAAQQPFLTGEHTAKGSAWAYSVLATQSNDSACLRSGLQTPPFHWRKARAVGDWEAEQEARTQIEWWLDEEGKEIED